MIKTYLDGVQLPVNPFDEIKISTKGNNKQYEVIDIGDVTRIGNRELSKIEIESLFTDNRYPFSSLASPLPAKDYVEKINAAMLAKKPVRLIVTGDGVDVNMLCSIESFDISQAFAETNEYYYTLSLKEYRTISIKRVKIAPAQAVATPVRPASRPTTRTYTVRSGDCLWNIAGRYYGAGAQWTKIYDANRDKIKNPNLIYPGQVFVIP